VSHYGLAIHIKKVFEGKKKNYGNSIKYFTMQKYNLQKKSSNKNQNPSRY
jgi:hypothetical protein